MKIKNKTKLRQIIKESVGNTGSLRKLAVFPDGTWGIFDTGTIPNAEMVYWGSLMPDWDCCGVNSIDEDITEFFKEIER